MAYTNQNFIADALREINVINENGTVTAEQGEAALRRLNEFMANEQENSVRVPWFEQTDLTVAIPIPDYARQALRYAFAVYVAPSFSAPVTPLVLGLARKSLKQLKRKFIAEELDNTDMSHLSEGSGHWGNRYDIQTDT